MTISRTKKRASQAADALHHAREALLQSRRRLAAATRSGSPSLFVHKTFAWAEALRQRRLRSLRNLPGIVGCALSRAFKAGLPTDEPCLTVYVRRKRTTHALGRRGRRALPRYVRHSRKKLRLDVVAVGQLERLALLGESIGPASDGGVIRKGTIGALAKDLGDGSLLGITAMHVTGYAEYPRGASTRVEMYVPSLADDPHAPQFGQLVQGSETNIDAAIFSLLDATALESALPQIGTVRGWRPLTYPGDYGTSVFLFGASTGYHEGTIVAPGAAMPNDGILNALLVRFPNALDHGDSGAAVLDSAQLVLGFLVGRYTADPSLSLFCPAGAVLAHLQCDIPTV